MSIKFLHVDPSKHFVIKITGADAERYLQGRITQDVEKLDEGQVKKSFLTTPTGQIEAIFNFTRNKEDYIFFSNPFEEFEGFTESLFLFKVADQVEYSRQHYHRYIFYSNNIESLNLGFKNLSENTLQFSNGKFAIKWRDSIEIFSKQEIHIPNDYIEMTEEEFHHKRIASKVLSPLNDLKSSKVIPNQTWLDEYVSFTKGCYAGQEVIETADSRGRINKRFYLLQITDGTINPEKLKLELNGKSIGKITSYSKNLALALCNFIDQKTELQGEGFRATVIE